MFGYQLVKRFHSPGYEIWEDWREHYLSTADRRTRQQRSQRQVVDTRSSLGISLIDQFRQPGRSSEECGFGSSYGLSRRGAFSKGLSGEVEDMSIAERGSRIRIPGDGNEGQTGPEVEFTNEFCGHTNQEI